jgi:hypothetical protein
MSELSWVPGALWGITLLAGFWPGVEPAPALEKPKKGYWTIHTVFWPIKRAYHDLWPHHAVLEKAASNCRLLAFAVAAAALIAQDWFHLSEVTSPYWVMAQIAAVAFLLGRASGFWSADRRISKAQESGEAVETKAEA